MFPDTMGSDGTRSPRDPDNAQRRQAERTERLRELVCLNRLISTSLDPDEALREIARSVAGLVGATVASFWLVDEASRTLELRAFSDEALGDGQTFRKAPFGQGAAGWVAEHRQMMLVDDVFADGRTKGLDWWRGHGLRSSLTVPVLYDDRLLAVLSLNGREPFSSDPEDLELLGGEIGVESEVGRGSTFWFTVCLERDPSAQAPDGSASGPAGAAARMPDAGDEGADRAVAAADSAGPRPCILLAEDNVVNQKVGVHMLGRLGYRADVVANGLEAIEALARVPYVAVLMDCQMPELDGYAAAAEIRRREAAGAFGVRGRTPIIAITAAALLGDRERCLAAGMDDYLTKPLRSEELAKALQRWVARSGPSAADRERAVPVLPESSAEDILDISMLAELRDPEYDGAPELLIEMIDYFFEDAPPRLSKLRTAVEQADADSLLRVAHSLKSSSGFLGARRMQDLCAQLEALGKAGSTDGAAALVETCEAEYERVRAALERVRQETAAEA